MASLAHVAILFLFHVICIHYKPFSSATQQNRLNKVTPGSSLSPLSSIHQASSWHSHSGRFAFGFYPQGSGFHVGIWLVGKPDIITWTAFRDDPPVSSNATLELTTNGELILRSDGDKEKHLANLKEPASYAEMMGSGNFVLYNESSVPIWESFNFPTDTILGGQSVYTGNELVSSISDTNSSTGKFRLKMQEDGNLVLYPMNTLDWGIDAYWASNTQKNQQIHLFLNYTGQLHLLNNTLSSIWRKSDYSSLYNNSVVYRATLEYNGFFRMYLHNFDGEDEHSTSLLWTEPDVEQCKVKGFCGFNSYCTMIDYQPDCRCLPGTDFIDPEHRSLGCQRNYNDEPCKGGTKDVTSYFKMVGMDSIKWDDLPYFTEEMTEEDCKQSCLEDCYCFAALLDEGKCQKHKLPVRYASRVQGDSPKGLFKLGLEGMKRHDASNPFPRESPVIRRTSKRVVLLILILCATCVTVSFVGFAISGLFIFKSKDVRGRMQLKSRNYGFTQELTLRAFSYEELKKATNSFKEELGKGSFGAVYKGKLYKGKKIIAVKRLEKVVNEGEKEFLTEMRAIGRTHHKNLVKLLGYCTEGSKRLLVYDYMSNGSLADLLFRVERQPDWNERMRIALDVARGILYLHEECEAPVIHCDIKPQNILMDKFWSAKISDFGLAKLLVPDQTRTFTMVRGTRGYLAPEWHKNTPISVKADVYSYGVVLLEIICCRKNLDLNVIRPDEIVLCNFVYDRLVARELDTLVVGEEVERQSLEKMVMIGIWCIQDEPALRPSMKSVVMMIEGISEVPFPPRPTSTST